METIKLKEGFNYIIRKKDAHTMEQINKILVKEVTKTSVLVHFNDVEKTLRYLLTDFCQFYEIIEEL